MNLCLLVLLNKNTSFFIEHIISLVRHTSAAIPARFGSSTVSVVMPALKRTRLTASAWRKANWCINCVLMRVMERRERDNS